MTIFELFLKTYWIIVRLDLFLSPHPVLFTQNGPRQRFESWVCLTGSLVLLRWPWYLRHQRVKGCPVRIHHLEPWWNTVTSCGHHGTTSLELSLPVTQSFENLINQLWWTSVETSLETPVTKESALVSSKHFFLLSTKVLYRYPFCCWRPLKESWWNFSKSFTISKTKIVENLNSWNI